MDCPVARYPSRNGAVDEEFARHVLEGLSASQKRLSSRYFYDDNGDRLFQAIMASPEYYLTNSELEILREQGDDIARRLVEDGPCEFIELGSGDGQKVGYLLDALHRHSDGWVYRPVDISDHSLELLKSNLVPSRPWLNIDPIHGNYFEVLQALEPVACRRVMMFLGSNLGNFGEQGSIDFLRLVRASMSPGDMLLIGLDLKKDPDVILAAYNDASGHTRDFNLNLLTRINRELGGNFDPDRFEHQPEYDPGSGAARSYLVSQQAHTVLIGALDREFQFEVGERMFMEISQKYDQAIIEQFCKASGFEPTSAFYDERRWFTDQVWQAVD